MSIVNRSSPNLITPFSFPLALTYDNVQQLFDAINRGEAWYSMSDLTSFISNLVYLPINVEKLIPPGNYKLTVNTFGASGGSLDINTTVDSVNVHPLGTGAFYGFILANYRFGNIEESEIDLDVDDFTSYEPYTNIRLYLPYFGYVPVDLKTVLAYGGQLNVILYIDYLTGNAKYLLAISNYADFTPNVEGIIYLTNTNSTIMNNVMSEYHFKFGIDVPFGTNGASEKIRNIVLGTIQTVGTVALAVATYGTSLAATTSTIAATTTTGSVVKALSPTTNRLRTVSKATQTKDTTKTVTTDSSGSMVRNAIQECFNNATYALENSVHRCQSINASGDVTSLGSANEICLFIEKCNIIDIDENYKHLYGVPLGETRRLTTLSGYTEISKIHLEGNGFEIATVEELSMIENALSNGFIL